MDNIDERRPFNSELDVAQLGVVDKLGVDPGPAAAAGPAPAWFPLAGGSPRPAVPAAGLRGVLCVL